MVQWSKRLCGERLRDKKRESLREMLIRCSGDQGYQGDKLSLQFISVLEREREKRRGGKRRGGKEREDLVTKMGRLRVEIFTTMI